MRDAHAVFGAWCAINYVIGIAAFIVVELVRRSHR